MPKKRERGGCWRWEEELTDGPHSSAAGERGEGWEGAGGLAVAARVGPGWNEREGEGIGFFFLFFNKFSKLIFLNLNLNKFSLQNFTHHKNECCSMYASIYF